MSDLRDQIDSLVNDIRPQENPDKALGYLITAICYTNHDLQKIMKNEHKLLTAVDSLADRAATKSDIKQLQTDMSKLDSNVKQLQTNMNKMASDITKILKITEEENHRNIALRQMQILELDVKADKKQN